MVVDRARVLIVDDEVDLREFVARALRGKGFDVDEAGTAEEGIDRLANGSHDVVILDIRLPGMSGIEALPKVREVAPACVAIVMTAYGSRELAWKAIELGAYDFFTKPFKIAELEIVLQRALERRRLERELRELRARIQDQYSFRNVIGGGPAMQEVFRVAAKVAPTASTVLVTGDSGTGKEMIAQAIHEASPRATRPFVKLNCVAIPEHLLESELFGHERGSFTGAVQRKLGKFELADGGTIFLDEIGDMSLTTQAKILRVLQEKEIDRIGGTAPIAVDVRVIAATNRDLIQSVREKRFREDLFFRLNVVHVYLPRLVDRREDLPLLVDHFIAKICARESIAPMRVAPEVMELFRSYDWPGNVRELENSLERAIVMADGDRVDLDSLPLHLQSRGKNDVLRVPEHTDNLDATLADIERDLIVDALVRAGGVQARAAEFLGINQRSLWHRVKKLRIDVRKLKRLAA
ncbi:MAG: sigma-54-dependent Fis family transcriptional regulator [Myxococcales bacterium]|nr:sigma-54-dependent Fis family transcriptional regulator [Myxococcales bacterium]